MRNQMLYLAHPRSWERSGLLRSRAFLKSAKNAGVVGQYAG
jgi:hypothetical protein